MNRWNKIIMQLLCGGAFLVFAFFIGGWTYPEKACPEVKGEVKDTAPTVYTGTDTVLTRPEPEFGEKRFFLDLNKGSVILKKYGGSYRFGTSGPESMEIWNDVDEYSSLKDARRLSETIALDIIQAEDGLSKQKRIDAIIDRLWSNVK